MALSEALISLGGSDFAAGRGWSLFNSQPLPYSALKGRNAGFAEDID